MNEGAVAKTNHSGAQPDWPLHEPGFAWTVCGLACVLVASQSMRLTTIAGIYPIEGTLAIRHALGVAVALLGVALYRRGQSARFSSSSKIIIAVSALATVVLFMKYESLLFSFDVSIVELLGKILEEAFICMLLLAWGERVIPHGFCYTMAAFSFAVVVAGLAQILLSFFQQAPCMVALSSLPLLSGVLLLQAPSAENAEESGPQEAAVASRFVTIQGPVAALVYFSMIFCLVLLIGNIQYESLNYQQQTSWSPFTQICIALGNILGGAILLATGNKIKPTVLLPLYITVMFALVSISFYLSTFLTGFGVGIYLLLASLANQIANAFIWLAPFTPAQDAPGMTRFAWGYVAHFSARMLSVLCMLATETYSVPLFNLFSSLALSVLLPCCIILIMRSFEGGSDARSALTHEDEEGKAEDEPADGKPHPTPFKSTIAAVAQDANLTPQETNVLTLLAQGYNAKSISEALVVSTNTTKSHMRNVYTKLGVHTQQELIAMVDERVKALK